MAASTLFATLLLLQTGQDPVPPAPPVADTPPTHQVAPEVARRLDAVKEFERFFKQYKRVSQQVEAVLTLQEADCPEAVQTLMPLLTHKEVDIREAAKKVMSGYREPATYEAVMAGLVDMKDRDTRGEFIDVISRAGNKALLGKIDEIWHKDKALGLAERYYMARAFERLGGTGFELILGELLKDRAYEVRVAACDALRVGNLKHIGTQVVPLLQDDVWQVQAAAIRCMGVLRTFEAVEPLIEFLDKEGRLRQDAADALFKITTRDIGTDYKEWKNLWKQLTAIAGFRLPSDEEVKKAEEARAKANLQYKPRPGDKTFAGIPTQSTRVVFVIDCSASMDDLVTDRKKFKDAGYSSFRKIDIVKEELIRTLNGLDQTTYFNIVAFAKETRPWKDWLVPGNITNKTSAISFAKRLEPLGVAAQGIGSNLSAAGDDSGKTNTFAALMAAFDLDPAKGLTITGSGDKKPPKLDTVYFLTDGKPSVGVYVDTEDILREVKKINEVRGVVIHAISIGEFDASFMKRLADQNGGVFVNLGG